MGIFNDQVKALEVLAIEMDKFKEEHKEEAEEVYTIMVEAGATLCAALTSKNPTLFLMADDLVDMTRIMFWLGYYTKATRTEVPEVFKSVLNGGSK